MSELDWRPDKREKRGSKKDDAPSSPETRGIDLKSMVIGVVIGDVSASLTILIAHLGGLI